MNITVEKVLNGKKILFFSWPFYQYPSSIKETIEQMGGEVKMYSSAPTNSFLVVRLLERVERIKKGYFDKIIKEIKDEHFDYLLMINAAVFPDYFLKSLVEECDARCKILYSWDSLAVYPKAKNMFKYFDYVYSFDRRDSLELEQVDFLPLFYCDNLYDYKVEDTFKYDFSFIGFGHTERYNFINSIKKFANENGYSYFFRLYLPSFFHFLRGKYITKIFPSASKKDFIYQSMRQDEIKSITNSTRIVVDLELSNQSGLTMRTIETHGMRKKLITTNPEVKNYDFYNENNILVVDRKKPIIDKSFIDSDYEMLDEKLYQKYSLTNWIKILFRV